MKKNKLGKLLTGLIILAICLISFVGVYVKTGNQVENILPEYTLGMNLSGYRIVKLGVNTTTNEVIYDAEGQVTTEGKNEDGSLKEGYTKKDEPVNAPDNLTTTNYEIVKKILEERLEKTGIGEYVIKLNYNSGEFTIELPENTLTDEIASNLAYAGKFEIQDSKSGEVLINNEDVKSASGVYGSSSSGTTVYLSIEFNKEGTKKLEEITKKYVKSEDEEGNDTTNKIKIMLDDDTLLETYFGETISTGILQLSIGSASTSSEDINAYLRQASNIAMLIDSGKMPVTYKILDNTYIETAVNMDMVKIVIGVMIAVMIIAFITWIIRYRGNGIAACISFVGLIALILLIVRYANVIISLESMVALVAIFVANYLFLNYIVKQFEKSHNDKKEIIKQAYKRYASILFPMLIVAVVFTFINWIPIASIGMVLFWGLTILLLYNYITVELLFETKEN